MPDHNLDSKDAGIVYDRRRAVSHDFGAVPRITARSDWSSPQCQTVLCRWAQRCDPAASRGGTTPALVMIRRIVMG